ncbi:amidohydrolase family protein [Pseudonocardia nematodicida]|uniref:Amidohydrolase family protein n=1 Tax=Pseudonocardia nematodicida TaxID=1206997 RepID=A0ABV1K3K9_9PSEU
MPTAARGVVDAHVHFFRRGGTAHAVDPSTRSVLDHDLGESELVADAATARGIDRIVLVQSANSIADAARLRDDAGRSALTAVVVGWITPTDPERADTELAQLVERGLLRGVRHLPGSPDDPWLREPAALEVGALLAEREVVLDVLGTDIRHLRDAARLAAELPGLRIVVDHMATPTLADREPVEWNAAVAALAQLPNVAVKFSVGQRELLSGRSHDRAAAAVLELFGPLRVMAASNWPVCRLRYGYAGMWQELRRLLRTATSSDIDQVVRGTAARIYRF